MSDRARATSLTDAVCLNCGGRFAERELHPTPAPDAKATPPMWTAFPVPRLPARLLDGVALLASHLDLVWGFAHTGACAAWV